MGIQTAAANEVSAVQDIAQHTPMMQHYPRATF